MAVSRVAPSLEYADRVLEALRRSKEHAESELSNNTATVMETVAHPESLVWSEGIAWASPQPASDGSFFVNIATDTGGVVEHYDWLHANTAHRGWYLRSKLATDWWTLWDSRWTGMIVATEQEITTDVLSLLIVDGDRGISGEMAWASFTKPENQTEAERSAMLTSYIEALKSGEVDRILSHYSDAFVGAAIRPYFGENTHFAALSDLAAVRSDFERFYSVGNVLDIGLTNWVVQDWYLFWEARWRVELEDGTEVGMLTVESMPLGQDGKIIGRLGTGTPAE
jgi:hypothetical protein